PLWRSSCQCRTLYSALVQSAASRRYRRTGRFARHAARRSISAAGSRAPTESRPRKRPTRATRKLIDRRIVVDGTSATGEMRDVNALGGHNERVAAEQSLWGHLRRSALDLFDLFAKGQGSERRSI